MKYITLITLLILFSCEVKHTSVVCPCNVTEVRVSSDNFQKSNMYRITVRGGSTGNYGETTAYPSFTFYSEHLYDIGDTIK